VNPSAVDDFGQVAARAGRNSTPTGVSAMQKFLRRAKKAHDASDRLTKVYAVLTACITTLDKLAGVDTSVAAARTSAYATTGSGVIWSW
jgi:spore maturation protein SpmA